MPKKKMYWVIFDLLVDIGRIKPICYGLGELDGNLIERSSW